MPGHPDAYELNPVVPCRSGDGLGGRRRIVRRRRRALLPGGGVPRGAGPVRGRGDDRRRPPATRRARGLARGDGALGRARRLPSCAAPNPSGCPSCRARSMRCASGPSGRQVAANRSRRPRRATSSWSTARCTAVRSFRRSWCSACTKPRSRAACRSPASSRLRRLYWGRNAPLVTLLKRRGDREVGRARWAARISTDPVFGRLYVGDIFVAHLAPTAPHAFRVDVARGPAPAPTTFSDGSRRSPATPPSSATRTRSRGRIRPRGSRLRRRRRPARVPRGAGRQGHGRGRHRGPVPGLPRGA